MTECPAGPGGGGGGGGSTTTCPSDGVGYKGDAPYIGQGPKAAPLRGTIGCVDANTDTGAPLTVTSARQTQTANIIYGPLEAGFSSQQFDCLGTTTIPGGIDTLIAENMVAAYCSMSADSVSVLDDCGGHASPYHYHERMSCLFSSDPETGHSTRIGTMMDGNGLYGKYVAFDTLPTDLDACGGRTGVTPDSNGNEVYYYMVQERAPFTVGCFGPVSSIAECRALYSDCGNGDEITVTTADYGTFAIALATMLRTDIRTPAPVTPPTPLMAKVHPWESQHDISYSNDVLLLSAPCALLLLEAQDNYTLSAAMLRMCLLALISDVVISYDDMTSANTFVDTYSQDSSSVFSSAFTDKYGTVTEDGGLEGEVAEDGGLEGEVAEAGGLEGE
eukprot:gene7695-9157_t